MLNIEIKTLCTIIFSHKFHHNLTLSYLCKDDGISRCALSSMTYDSIL